MRTPHLFALAALGALAACQPAPSNKAATDTAASAPAAPVMPKAQASVVELMATVIAPTADIIWGAVGTTEGPKGPVETKPTTDKDWADLRKKVMLMVEAANLLAVPDRTVLLPGQKFTNPPGPGDLPPEKSQAQIKAEWPAFLAYAQTLQNSALAALKAVDAKDLDGFQEAGGAIDEACEQCHKRFWYPDAPAAAAPASKAP
jgi:hypothetical protein